MWRTGPTVRMWCADDFPGDVVATVGRWESSDRRFVEVVQRRNSIPRRFDGGAAASIEEGVRQPRVVVGAVGEVVVQRTVDADRRGGRRRRPGRPTG